MLNSIDEILSTAKQIEESSYNFYTKALEIVKTPYLKEQLRDLAEQEIDHRKKIETMMSKGPEEVAKGLKLEHVQDMKLGDYLMPSHIDSKATIQDILIASIKREDLTHQFYQNILRGASDPDFRKVLEYLSIEELKHKNRVQYLYDELVYQEN